MLEQKENCNTLRRGERLLQLLVQLKPVGLQPWPVASQAHERGVSGILHGTKSVSQPTLASIHHNPLFFGLFHIASCFHS